MGRRSIFLGQHDGQNAGRNSGIGRVRRGVSHRQIVGVDLPKYPLASMIKEAEIPLPMRVVIAGEVRDRRQLHQDRRERHRAKDNVKNLSHFQV